MSAPQPIPTTLPPPRPFDQLHEYDRKSVEFARDLKAIKAHHGDDQDGFEAHLRGIDPDLLAPFFFLDTPTWVVRMEAADRYDLTDDQLLAKCRAGQARRYAKDVGKGRCRSPTTPAEQTLVDRWIDMHAYESAVGIRLHHRQPASPRLRALTKRLAKLGLIYNWRLNRTPRAPEPKLPRDDQLWAAASRRPRWAKAVVEHGESTARRLWEFARYTRAQNEIVRLEAQTASMERAFDRVLHQASVIWNAGGKGASEAVFDAIRQAGREG